MNLSKAGITLAALVLSGCASDPWQQPSAGNEFKPTLISVVEKVNLSAFCTGNRSILDARCNCAKRTQCIVFVKSGLPEKALGCIVTHETRHCFDSALEAAAAKTHFPAECGVSVAATAPLRTGE